MALHGFNYRLRWSDFKTVAKRPDGKSDAQTVTNIGVKWQSTTGPDGNWRLTKVIVSVILNRSQMWVVRGKQTSDLLAHEQVHYDISAIAARTLESRLITLSGDRLQKPADAVGAVWSNIGGEVTADGRVVMQGLAQAVQDLYDEDAQCGSEHGLQKVNQAEWELRLSNARLDKTVTIDELNSCPRPKSGAAAAGE